MQLRFALDARGQGVFDGSPNRTFEVRMSGRAQVDSGIGEHSLEVILIVLQTTHADPVLVAYGGTPAQEWVSIGTNGKAQS